ncbi:NADH-quinone oxidoreductase subunit H [Candidatus Sumerlaeota bacterium]|nr:NADH-quinone oxidoreductase subunit H [Candidatus Sumerlaeota bacterium]
MSPMAIELIYRGTLAFVVVNAVMGYGGLLSWLERKQSALMQNRIGANRASILGIRAIGLIHMLSDGIKMLTKEDWRPPGADRLLHTIAPLLSIGFAVLVFAAIPFGDRIPIQGMSGEWLNLRVCDIDLGLLAVFAILGMGVYGVVLAGLSSNNNFGLIGALRAGAQMISYEIALGISIMGIVLIFGTLDLQGITRAQGGTILGFLPNWGIFLQPVGFLIFMTAIFAESKRVPFDLPECESEIIGYSVEYSGMKFGLFLFADFVESLIGAVLCSILFFGGWQIPWVTPPADPTWGWALLSTLAFGIKVLFFTWLFMTIRWTFPRFRYDQLMDLCWKIMLPIALANLVITAIIVALIRAHGGA